VFKDFAAISQLIIRRIAFCFSRRVAHFLLAFTASYFIYHLFTRSPSLVLSFSLSHSISIRPEYPPLPLHFQTNLNTSSPQSSP
jgi:hypothetical protein